MSRGRKTPRTQAEHEIFGDEEAAQIRSDLDTLRSEVLEIAGRLHAQFTTIAAHAEIAREQAEFVRQEAHADLERTREALIDLIEHLRAEVSDRVTPGGGAKADAATDRFEAIERRFEQLDSNVERCVTRQQELADTMAAFLDTVLADQRGEPVTGLSMS